MPEATISNPAGVWGVPTQGGGGWFYQEVVYCVNASGGNMTTGQAVILSQGPTGGATALTTTSVLLPSVILSNVAANTGDIAVFGIVGTRDSGLVDQQLTSGGTVSAGEFATFAANAVVPIIVRGFGRVLIGTGTVAAGVNLVANNTGGAGAVGAAGATPTVGTNIGISLESQANKDTNNTIRAYIQKM